MPFSQQLFEVNNGGEQLKRIFAFVSFIFIGFTLLVNTDPTSVDIFTKTTRTIPEPIALLLFGSVLIGLAKVVRKKVFKKETDMIAVCQSMVQLDGYRHQPLILVLEKFSPGDSGD